MWDHTGWFRLAETGNDKSYKWIRRGWGRVSRPFFNMWEMNFCNELQFSHKYTIIRQRFLGVMKCMDSRKESGMFSDNLIELRKIHKMSQEELAERLQVSRQTISKYETGESLPDIDKCKQLADIFNVSLDDLVNYEKVIDDVGIPPRGKHLFGTVKVGEKGQIVIPAKARKIFHIETGDRLIVLGDETQGIALVNEKEFLNMMKQLRKDK